MFDRNINVYKTSTTSLAERRDKSSFTVYPQDLDHHENKLTIRIEIYY